MWEGPERDRNLRHSNRIEVIKALRGTPHVLQLQEAPESADP